MTKISELAERMASVEQRSEMARLGSNSALGHVLALRVAFILQSAGLRADDPAGATVLERMMQVPADQDGGMRRDVKNTLKILAREVSDFQAERVKH